MTFLALYGAIAAIYLVICLLGAGTGTYYERRIAARYAFAAPVWPLALVWLLIRGVVALWRTAFS